jgi:hypothetical protein
VESSSLWYCGASDRDISFSPANVDGARRNEPD